MGTIMEERTVCYNERVVPRYRLVGDGSSQVNRKQDRGAIGRPAGRGFEEEAGVVEGLVGEGLGVEAAQRRDGGEREGRCGRWRRLGGHTADETGECSATEHELKVDSMDGSAKLVSVFRGQVISECHPLISKSWILSIAGISRTVREMIMSRPGIGTEHKRASDKQPLLFGVTCPRAAVCTLDRASVRFYSITNNQATSVRV